MVEVLHKLKQLWSEVGSAQLLAQLLGLWFGELVTQDITTHQHYSPAIQQLRKHRQHKIRWSGPAMSFEVF